MPSTGSFVAVVGLAVVLAAGCDSTTRHVKSATRHYSAEKFKRCMVNEHAPIALTPGNGYTATSMMWPRFGEWVYFWETAEAASAERARMKSETAPSGRVWFQLFRTQRSNTLVFAPAQEDWFSPIKGCLERARD